LGASGATLDDFLEFFGVGEVLQAARALFFPEQIVQV